jgi:hypothetical protein
MLTRKQQDAIERSIHAPHLTRDKMMPKRAGLLNVREHLEWTNRFMDYLIEATEKKQATIPDGYVMEMRKIRLVGRAILKKHKAKNEATNSRKDVYVEVRTETLK